MDLAFNHAELVAERQNLDLKCDFGLPAKDEEVERERTMEYKRAKIMGRHHDHRPGHMWAPQELEDRWSPRHRKIGFLERHRGGRYS